MIIDTAQKNLYYCTGNTKNPGYIARLAWNRGSKTWHFEEFATFSETFDPVTRRPTGGGSPDAPLVYKTPKAKRFKSKQLHDVIHKVMRTRKNVRSTNPDEHTRIMPLFYAPNDKEAIQVVKNWHKYNDVSNFWWDKNIGEFIVVARLRFQIEDPDFGPNPCAEVDLEVATKCYVSAQEEKFKETLDKWAETYARKPSTEIIDMKNIYNTVHYIYGTPVKDCDVADTLSRLASEMEGIVKERNRLLDIEKSASEIGDETMQLPNSVFKDLEKRMKQCKKAIKKLGGKVG